MYDTQKDEIIKYLLIHESITPMEAFANLGITKLSTRIGELERDGYVFNRGWAESFGGNSRRRFRVYALAAQPDEVPFNK